MEHDEHDSNNDDINPELMEQFETWSKSDPTLGGPELGTEAPDKAFLLVQARRSRKIRFYALLIVTFLCGYGVVNTLGDTEFYFQDTTPKDLGDLREAYVSHSKKTLDAEPNSYVKAQNMMFTLDANDKGGKYTFFFCPLYNIIVRTEQDIKIPRDTFHNEISEAGAAILNSSTLWKFNVFELRGHVDVQGRFVPLTDAPKQFKNAWETTFAPALDGRGLDKEDVYVLVDGETPGESHIYPISILLSILFVLTSAFFFWRSILTERKLAMQFAEKTPEAS